MESPDQTAATEVPLCDCTNEDLEAGRTRGSPVCPGEWTPEAIAFERMGEMYANNEEVTE